MRKTSRVGAYGLLTDDDGRTLLQFAGDTSIFPGSWWVPGGGVEHGENPADTVVREFAEETGLTVEITGVSKVCAAVINKRPDHLEHNTLVLYDVKATGGALRTSFEDGQSQNRWIDPAEIDGTPMSPTVAKMLDRTGTELIVTGDGGEPPTPPGLPREQRVGAYAWITDPDARVLLTMIPPGFWGAGLWHLPGGGVDFGEQPDECLVREIYEETNQEAVLEGLFCVASRHDPRSVNPQGDECDFHGVNFVYHASIPVPRPLEILDVGGSTSELRWFGLDEIRDLPLTPVVHDAMRLAGQAAR